MTDKCDMGFCLSYYPQLSVYHLGQRNYICNILRYRRTKCFYPQRSISKEKAKAKYFRPVMIIIGDCTVGSLRFDIEKFRTSPVRFVSIFSLRFDSEIF
jgi:hypothetical protein